MPYIPQEVRSEFLPRPVVTPATAGELNFQLTALVIAYLRENGRSYAKFNDIVGALECAKLEAYRRVIAPHEDKKMAENGDVYP